jgi:hypothetical protein
MNRSVWSAAVLVAAAFALGACTTSRFGAPVRVASAGPVMVEPEPVEPVPTGPMASSELPPLDGSPVPLGGGMEVAGLPPASAPIAPSRSAFVGSWSAREASGTSCRVQLSSAPALDLYRASASGCANKDLAAVTAWDYRDGEVYLYQRGGAVAARLRASGGSLDGVLAKSGAPIALLK